MSDEGNVGRSNNAFRFAVFVGAAIAVAITILLWGGLRAPGDPRHRITTSLAGITNSGGADYAVIRIVNKSNHSVFLWGLSIERVGVRPWTLVPGITNAVHRVSPLTNLVISASGTADFLFDAPAKGQTWIARMEFARTGPMTRFREFLMRRKEPWIKMLPWRLRSLPIYVASQTLTREPAPDAPTLPYNASNTTAPTNHP